LNGFGVATFDATQVVIIAQERARKIVMSKTVKVANKVMGSDGVVRDDSTGNAGIITGFKIERNLPVPTARQRGRWAFLADTQVGDSFFINGRDEAAKNTARQAYQAALKSYGKKMLTRLAIGSADSGYEGQEGIQCFIAGLVE